MEDFSDRLLKKEIERKKAEKEARIKVPFGKKIKIGIVAIVLWHASIASYKHWYWVYVDKPKFRFSDFILKPSEKGDWYYEDERKFEEYIEKNGFPKTAEEHAKFEYPESKDHYKMQKYMEEHYLGKDVKLALEDLETAKAKCTAIPNSSKKYFQKKYIEEKALDVFSCRYRKDRPIPLPFIGFDTNFVTYLYTDQDNKIIKIMTHISFITI